jgi:N-acetylmuramoyl-L-alanine amidase
MKICLDAGHFGKVNRSRVVREYYESEMNWKLHNYLAQELERYGVTVVKTRADQAKDLSLSQRGKASVGCDLFLSIHSNATDAEYVDYPLVVTMQDGRGDKLGLAIAKKIEELMGTVQKGKITKKKNPDGTEWYGVLRGADSVGTVGMIIEHSFHSNIKATKWLLVDENLKAMAKAEADLIAEHYGLNKQSQPVEKPVADETDKVLKVGDVVIFTGSKHYKSSDASHWVECKPGVARITAIAPGKAHPYHLIRTDKVGPYGWVNEADIAEAGKTETWEPQVGDIVKFTGSKQYSSSGSNTAKGAVAGQAEITAMAPGKKHPYHLVRTGKTGPWGWVDAGTFTKVK